jgi:hypothetical protein
MKEQLKHITYDLYLLVLLVLTFFSFTGQLQPYLIPIVVGIGVLFILAGSNIFYVLPIPFFIQMSFSDMRDNVAVTSIFGIVIFVLVLMDLLKNRQIRKKGYLFWPFMIFVVASIVTHINSPDLFTTFAGFIQIFVPFLLYMYFLNTMNKKDDNIMYISKMILYMAMLVSLEMMYMIYQSGDVAIEVIRSRQIDVGWENLNIIIYANILSIPLIAYLVHKSKIKIIYMVFAVISIIGILLTLSRSSLLTLGLFVVVLVPLLFVLSKQRLSLMLQGVFFILCIGIGAYLIESQFNLITEYIEALESRNLTYIDDRDALLVVAWEQLKLHPLFGSGGLYSSRVHLAEAGFSAVNYHNTMAQASTLGAVGIVAFVYLFAKKLQMIMLSKSTFKWFAIILLLMTAFVNGALQPMYFYTSYMIMIFLIIAAIEVTIKPLE